MSTDHRSIISGNLRRIRHSKNLRQRDIAEQIGMTASHFSRIESGSMEPTISTLAKIAGALGIELYELLLPLNYHEQDLTEKVRRMRDLPDEDRLSLERLIDITLERDVVVKGRNVERKRIDP